MLGPATTRARKCAARALHEAMGAPHPDPNNIFLTNNFTAYDGDEMRTRAREKGQVWA